jgi:four helix bundle protein
MNRGQTFEDLAVWQKSMNLTEAVYKLCREAPLTQDRGLRDQLQRAAVSLGANIAEGYERGTRKEYIQFLVIAKGSAGELRSLLHLVARLQIARPAAVDALLGQVIEVSKMLFGLIRSLQATSRP